MRVLWIAGNPPPNRRIVFIGLQDKETAALHISCEEWPSVKQVVVVLPAAMPYLGIISVLASLEACEQACESIPFSAAALLESLDSVDESARAIAEALAALHLGLRRFDGPGVVDACASLLDAQRRAPPLPTSTASSITMIAAFAENFGRGLLSEWSQPGYFLHENHHPRNKNWWKTPPTLGASLFRASEQFRTTVTGPYRDAFKEVRYWLISLREETLKLHFSASSTYSGMTPRSEGSVFRIASAFMAFSADLHKDGGRYVLALICLHRASEWMMAALCDDNNMLDYTSHDGFRLRTTGSAPGYAALQLGLLTADSTALKGMNSKFSDLNSWRNLLVYTHHMSAPTAHDADILFSAVRSTLPALGGPEWRDCLAVLKKPFPLRIVDLIDPFQELRSGITISSSSDLVAEMGLSGQ
jgi:hypothetical protein